MGHRGEGAAERLPGIGRGGRGALHDGPGAAKLEKLEDHKGARCAVVLISVKAAGTIKGQEALKSSFDIRGRLWLDVAKGRVLTMKGEGEGKIEGTLDQEGEKIKLDGTFTISIDAAQVYE